MSGTSYTVAAGDQLFTRLQQLIAGWRGAERSQQIIDLYQEYRDIASAQHGLAPYRLAMIRGLDEATLRRQLAGFERASPRFRVAPIGQFDAALVPVASASRPDQWLLAINADRSIRDQVALLGHALGHLLLNATARQLEQRLPLDPADGYVHIDTLAELRQSSGARRNQVDRRVLDTYPTLTALLQPETTTPFETPSSLAPLLAQSGWRGLHVNTPYNMTDGRIFLMDGRVSRGWSVQIDALLRAHPSLPIAVVHQQRQSETTEDATRNLLDRAQNQMAVPYAYLVGQDGAITEFDYTGTSVVQQTCAALPDRELLFDRWVATLGLDDPRNRATLAHPYSSGEHQLRYYQEAAINRAMVAILQAKRGLRPRRLLLTLATGTGKTQIAFQLAWKLVKSRAIRSMLYVADRDVLLVQAKDKDFQPFTESRYRVKRVATTSREVGFSTYQAIAESDERRGLFRDYQRNFFDLIIVDECHRGSAQQESRWHEILQYFEGAIQLGMTATPLRDANAHTYNYYGTPLYSYPLRAGINDGFLAPYRVHRVVLGEMTLPADAAEQAEEVFDQGESAPTATPLPQVESAARLRAATTTIARHIANYQRINGVKQKMMVFCIDQDHALKMRDALRQELAKESESDPNYVTRIVNDDGSEGRRALDYFSSVKRQSPVIVTTSRLLSTGVDVPMCKTIVLARPVGSIIEFKQIIGRGTRLNPPQKTWFTILDYAGASVHFLDEDFDGDPELATVEELPVEQPTPAADDAPTTDTPAPDAPAVVEDEAPPSSDRPINDNDGSTPANEPDRTGIIAQQQTPQYEAQPIEPADAPNEAESAVVVLPSDPPATEPTPDTLSMDAPPEVAPTPTDPTENTTVAHNNGQETSVVESVAPPAPPDIYPLPTPPPAPPMPSAPPTLPPRLVTRPRDRTQIVIVGEIIQELGPDGHTLRETTYDVYARDVLRPLIATPEELRQRWLDRTQRENIVTRLRHEGIDLYELPAALKRPELDAFDLLGSLLFALPTPTRHERAERVRNQHAEFFAGFPTQASEILLVLLDKYAAGEAPDLTDTKLLEVTPLRERGTKMELMQTFGGGTATRAAMQALQALIYAAVP